MVGTAAYLAPEQARGEEATPAADVYALGVVIYQLLTGRLPWEGSTLAELAIRRENERPLPPTSYDPDVPETLSRAVLRSLEGDVGARYSSARELSRRAAAPASPGASRATPADELPTNMIADRRHHGRHQADGPRSGDPRLAVRAGAAPPAAPAPAPAPRRAAARPACQRLASRPAGGSCGRSGSSLLIALLAAVIAAVVLLVTDAGQNTDIGIEIKEQLQDQIQNLEDFVRDNTQ